MGRLLSDSELRRQSADSLEYLYDDGRASKADVTAWVRLSSKMSGRIYQPRYQSLGGPTGFGRVKLRRREDLEDKLFAKKGGYWRYRRKSRDRRVRRDVSWHEMAGGNAFEGKSASERLAIIERARQAGMFSRRGMSDDDRVWLIEKYVQGSGRDRRRRARRVVRRRR